MGTRLTRELPLNGGKWQRLRAHVLAVEPLCRHCAKMGLTTPALDVDHIDNNPNNNRPENLQALCHGCHSRKTQQDMGKKTGYSFGADGMPVTGWTPKNHE